MLCVPGRRGIHFILVLPTSKQLLIIRAALLKDRYCVVNVLCSLHCPDEGHWPKR